MKIAVILGSHRVTGKNKEIADAITQINIRHELTFIRMAESRVNGCTTCYKCSESKRCITDDDFASIYDTLKRCDAIMIISPLYAPIPSRLTAFFERLTSFMFATNVINTDDNPLLNKKAAVFSYCSNKICDDTQLKLIFQKFLMKNYDFTDVVYDYLNNCENADEVYNHNIIDYVKDVFLKLSD